MGLPRRCRAASAHRERRPPPAGKTLAHQPNSWRRTSPIGPHRTAHRSLLQTYTHPRNRSFQPGFDSCRTLAGKPPTVKDVQRQNVKDVLKLDSFNPLLPPESPIYNCSIGLDAPIENVLHVPRSEEH